MKITQKAMQLSLELFDREFNEESRKIQYHFSFLFERNKLVAAGSNSYELSKKALYFADRYNVPQKKHWPSLHSEIAAISKLWGRYNINKRIKLVNVRFLRSGQIGSARPCPDCMEVLNALGITQIYWSTDDGFEGSE